MHYCSTQTPNSSVLSVSKIMRGSAVPVGALHSVGHTHLSHTDALYVREGSWGHRQKEKFNSMLFINRQRQGGIFAAEGTKMHCCLQTTHMYKRSKNSKTIHDIIYAQRTSRGSNAKHAHRCLLFGSVCSKAQQEYSISSIHKKKTHTTIHTIRKHSGLKQGVWIFG